MLQLWFGWYMEGGYCIYCFVLTGLLNNASLFIFLCEKVASGSCWAEVFI